MKRTLSFFLVLLLLISLFTGCNKEEIQSDAEPSENTSSTQENQPKENNTEDEIGFKTLNEDLIDAVNVMEIIEELTSEQYDGRLSGSEGNILAVDYIVEYFKGLGLENPEGLDDFKQSFSHHVKINNETPVLKVLDNDGNVIQDYEFIYDFSPTVYISGSTIKGETIAQAVLINNIDELNSDKGLLEGKVIVVPEEVLTKGGYQQFFTKALSNDLGIVGVIYEVQLKGEIDYFPVSPRAKAEGYGNMDDGPMIFRCDGEAFSDLIEQINQDMLIKMKIDFSVTEVESYNIIGLLPGTDENLKNECIIISGHMDHVGNNKNGTYNPGALDNASGTASVMEIARILTQSKIRPKKAILFIAFNGEEEGLCGSKHYVTDSLFPLSKTTVINLDMIGSKSEIPLEIASALPKGNALREELRQYCKKLGIDSIKRTSQGSDHAPFGNLGVDAVMLIHFDELSGYHSPNDTIESVDKDRIKEVIKLVLYYLDKNAY